MSQHSEILEQTFTEDLYHIMNPVVILIPEPWGDLSQDDITLLSKILQSVNLSLSAVHVISRSTIKIEELSSFSPTIVLSFGTSIQPIKTEYETYRHNEITILIADKLSALDEDRKKILWAALKQMFLSS